MQSVLQDYLDRKEREKEAIYQKAQGVSRRRKEEKSPERSKNLSKQIESKSKQGSGISDELLKVILEDQELLKKAILESFSTYMALKTAEYERQRKEGAENSAAVTQEENDRFRNFFLFLKRNTEESIELKK